MQNLIRFVFVVFLVVGLSACGSNKTPETVEYKLAVLDTGAHAGPSVTIRYKRVLDSLETKCSETRSRIGDVAFAGVDIFKSRTRQTFKIVEVAELIDAAIPAGVTVKCSETLAAIITLS